MEATEITEVKKKKRMSSEEIREKFAVTDNLVKAGKSVYTACKETGLSGANYYRLKRNGLKPAVTVKRWPTTKAPFRKPVLPTNAGFVFRKEGDGYLLSGKLPEIVSFVRVLSEAFSS